jgi:hypothetical protein
MIAKPRTRPRQVHVIYGIHEALHLFMNCAALKRLRSYFTLCRDRGDLIKDVIHARTFS